MTGVPTEIWRPVPSTNGLYEASSEGRIRRAGKARPLAPYMAKKGQRYLYTLICIEGKPYNRLTHRLVCEAFNGPCGEGMQCAHYDGNRLNNRPDNLRWTTSKENHADRIRHGNNLAGETNGRAKLSEEDVDEIRGLYQSRDGARLKNGELLAIARKFGVNGSTISRIASGRNWRTS